jgi:uncharacterized protein (TIGR00730 family)
LTDTAERIVCVYCASSETANPVYRQAAERLGAVLARGGCTVIYGGGGSGSMRALADGALSAGGRVVGILPSFMAELEWAHPDLSQLEIVEDMRARKHRMLTGSDGVVALPGGTGTFEELFEALTLKRLGLYLNPIVLVNTRRFFDPLLEALEAAVRERFMDDRHRRMWQVVREPEEVLTALATAERWDESARAFAVPRR